MIKLTYQVLITQRYATLTAYQTPTCKIVVIRPVLTSFAMTVISVPITLTFNTFCFASIVSLFSVPNTTYLKIFEMVKN